MAEKLKVWDAIDLGFNITDLVKNKGSDAAKVRTGLNLSTMLVNIKSLHDKIKGKT